MNRQEFISTKRKPKYESLSQNGAYRGEIVLRSIWQLNRDMVDFPKGRYQVVKDPDPDHLFSGFYMLEHLDLKMMNRLVVSEQELREGFIHIASPPPMPKLRIIIDGLGEVDEQGVPLGGWKFGHWFSHPIRRWRSIKSHGKSALEKVA